MKTKVSNFTEFRAYYLSEFELYDGEAFITFNIVGIDLDRNEVQVAVSDRGKISVVTYGRITVINLDGVRQAFSELCAAVRLILERRRW